MSITSFSKRQKEDIQKRFNNQDENARIEKIFYGVALDFLNDEDSKQCEADFYSRLTNSLASSGLANDKESVADYLKMLRVNNAIDDVFFDIVYAINDDSSSLSEIDLKKAAKRPLLNKHDERLEKNNLEELYSNFKSWPDEKSSCSSQEFLRLKESVVIASTDKEKDKAKYLATLNFKALEKNLISLETYNRLEFYRSKSNVSKRYIWLNDYFKIILNAKNKMVPHSKSYVVKNLEAEDNFASERLKRFSRLTQRKLLYKKYNETQIMLLAQVLQKASRRMGVDPDTITKAPYLTQEFSVLNENGERETYVEQITLDPQSQYNLARRLLRKDIVDLQMMSIFNKTNITYEDLVMASLEVGYISLEDIEYVVKYDDLWNPSMTKYERVSKFVFKVSGYATFFLPPPFNMLASLALGIAEGIVDNKINSGVKNDNPGTFIE